MIIYIQYRWPAIQSSRQTSDEIIMCPVEYQRVYYIRGVLGCCSNANSSCISLTGVVSRTLSQHWPSAGSRLRVHTMSRYWPWTFPYNCVQIYCGLCFAWTHIHEYASRITCGHMSGRNLHFCQIQRVYFQTRTMDANRTKIITLGNLKNIDI